MRKLHYTLRFLFLSFLLSGYYHANAADFYWVNDSGNWSDYANHWATTSGGNIFYAQHPSAADNVFFDAKSFSTGNQMVTIDVANADCKNMTWTGVNHTPQLKVSAVTNILNIYGSLTFTSGMTVDTIMGPVNFLATTAGNTITTAGLNMNNNFTFDGVGGEWILQDDLTLGKGDYNRCSIILTNGSLNTNDKTVTIGKFVSIDTTVRELTLGSSTINITYFSAYGWHVYPGTNLTLNAGASTINMTCNLPIWQSYFEGGGKTYNNLHFTGASAAIAQLYGGGGGSTFNGDVSFATEVDITGDNIFNGNTTFYGSGNILTNNIFNNVTFTPGYTYTLRGGKTQTITGTLSADGACTDAIIIKSSNTKPTTISKSSDSVTVRHVVLTSVAATGGAVFTAINSTDMSGNTGWSFAGSTGGTAGVSITASPSGNICPGTHVQFSAVQVNGGTAPVYQWKKNGTDTGGNAPDYSDNTLLNNDVISCTMISSSGHCASDSIVVSVIPGGSAGTITATKDTICATTPAVLNVSGTSGNIQWQSSASPSGPFTDVSGETNSSYVSIPAQTNYYRVKAGSGNCSDTSLVPYEIVVQPSPNAGFTYTVTDKTVNFTNTSADATTYLWHFGDGQTSTEENPSHTYAPLSDWHVCLDAANGSNCSFTTCIDVWMTGIQSIKAQQQWDIFPNPVIDNIIIRAQSGNLNIESVTVTDLLGRKMIDININAASSSQVIINAQSLPRGMYILKIIAHNTLFTQSFIKW